MEASEQGTAGILLRVYFIHLKRDSVNLRKILNPECTASASPIQDGTSSSRSLATGTLHGAFVLPPLGPNARREFPVAASTTNRSPVFGPVCTMSLLA